MAHVIFHKFDTIYLRNHMKKGWSKFPESFKTERAAKAALTRAIKKNPELKREDFEIAEKKHFHEKIEKTRTTRNLLNPEAGPFRIPVNTPNYMDPGSETYHST